MAIAATNQLDASEAKRAPCNGHRRDIIFALQMSIPLIEFGTRTIEVTIDETDGVDHVLKLESVSADLGEQPRESPTPPLGTPPRAVAKEARPASDSTRP